jgi:hypothetical protein
LVASIVKKRTCHLCGKRFKKGGLKYRLKAELVSDFDGYLSLPYDEKKDYSQEIRDTVEALKGKSEKELEEEVYQKLELLLCPDCKRKLISFLKSGEIEE